MVGVVNQSGVFREVRSADGKRQLTVQESGNPWGNPVFLLHGTPGSRLGPLPRTGLLYRLGVRLITFDRPGYGGSTSKPGRQVASVAKDVKDIAEQLGFKKFAIVGRSGGGPHALAVAALLPELVTRAAALVSLAPPDAKGLDWFDGMSPSNVREYMAASSAIGEFTAVDELAFMGLISSGEHASRFTELSSSGEHTARFRELLFPGELTFRLVQAAAKIKADPISHVATISPEMPESDRRIVSAFAMRAMLADNFGEAVRTSADGWIDDALAFCAPWGFDVSDIKAPVLVWHGERDVFSPVAHSLWLAKHIPRAETWIRQDSAHFGALEALPDVLSWLIRPDWED
jgi:pimeloyl-ACP methyl ester carboxylesterase